MPEERGYFAKYFLFYCNVLVWLFGLFVLAIGIWALSEKGFFDKIALVSSFPFDPVILLICISILTICISFMGFVGALRENVNLLLLFSICITGIFVVEFIFGILGFAFKDKFSDEFAKFVNKTIKNYRDDIDLQNLIDFAQEHLQCCGGPIGPDDWENNIFFNCSAKWPINGVMHSPYESCGVPFSCCIQTDLLVKNTQCGYGIRRDSVPFAVRAHVIHTMGCVQGFEDWLRIHLYSVAGVFIAIALLQIIPLVFALSLKGEIQQIKKRWEKEAIAYEAKKKPPSGHSIRKVAPMPQAVPSKVGSPLQSAPKSKVSPEPQSNQKAKVPEPQSNQKAKVPSKP